MFAKSDVFIGGALVLVGVLLQTLAFGVSVLSADSSMDSLIIEELQRGIIDAEAWIVGKNFPNTSANSTQRARESLANLVGDLTYNLSYEFASEAELYRDQFVAEKDILSLGRDVQAGKKLITDLLTLHATREKIVTILHEAYYLVDELLREYDRDIFVHTYVQDLIDEHKTYGNQAFQRLLVDIDYTYIKDNIYTCENVSYRIGSAIVEPIRYGLDCERIETSAINSEREYVMTLYTIVLNSKDETPDQMSQSLKHHLFFGKSEDANRELLAEFLVLVLTQLINVNDLGGNPTDYLV
jgi:hypothetical protein